jgi:hypothetical protein
VGKGVPDQALSAAEQAVPEAQLLAREGLPGLWHQITSKLGDLKSMILGKLSDFLIPTVLVAGITWIISLLNPASAFVKAVKAIIDIVTFIFERGAQVLEFVNSVLDAIVAIAGGGAGGVPALIENALAKSIPVLIGFLAALLGVGGIAEKVKEVIQAISRPVTKIVDWVVDKVAGAAKKIWARIKGVFGGGKEQTPEQKQARLDKAMSAAQGAVSRFGGKWVGRAILTPILAGIRLRYGLTALNLVQEGDVWAVEGEINPKKKWTTTIRASTRDYDISTTEPTDKDSENTWTDAERTALVAALRKGVLGFLNNGFTGGQLDKLKEYQQAALKAKKDEAGPLWGKFWEAFYKFRGERVHNYFKTAAQADESLEDLILFAPGVKEPDVRTPVASTSGRWWADVTTAGEWSAHFSRYSADFGNSALGLIYKIKSKKHQPK